MDEPHRKPRKSLLAGLRQDLYFSLRSLRRSPGLASAVVLTLVIGIAAASTVGSIAWKVLLQPLAIRNPTDVVVIWANSSTHAPSDFPIWGEEYKSFARNAASFDKVGAYEFHGAYPRFVQVADSAISLQASGVSGSLFDLLGTRPVRGRLLRPDDDRVGAEPVLVISTGLWRRAFANDPNIVGRRVKSDGQSATIVGVAPPTLDFPHGAEAWFPLATYGGNHRDSILAFVHIVGRRKPNVSNAQVAAEFLAFLRNPDAVHFPSDRVYLPSFSSAVTPIEEIVNGPARPTVLLLSGAGLLLLIATCVNAAILLLVRTLSRRTEMAVRSALGASRGQVGRQIVVESLMLSIVSGVVALAVAWSGARLLFATVPIDLPHLDGANLDGTLAFTTLMSALLAGLFVSVLPTMIVARVEPDAMLRAHSGSAGRGAERLRSGLVGVQVAMAVCSLAAAALVVESFANLRRLDLGFQPDNLLLVRIASNVPRGGDLRAESIQYRNLLDQLGARIQGLPGIVSVSPMYLAPFNHGGNDATFIRPDQALAEVARQPMVNLTMASPTFLRTLGIPLVRGRTFTSADDETAPLVVLVDETYARQMWPAEDPVGKRIKTQRGREWTVVGVVGATHLRDLRVPSGTVYVPVRQYGVSLPPYLAIRTKGSPVASIRSVREAVRDANLGQMFVADAQGVEGMVQRELSTPQLSAALLAAFGLSILLLCAIGLHGSLSAYVRHRHFDIAVRMAVGADPARMAREILTRGVIVAAVGGVAGGLAFFAGSAMLRAVVFDVKESDPVLLVASIIGVLVVAGAACYLPARRSARINPADALRAR